MDPLVKTKFLSKHEQMLARKRLHEVEKRATVNAQYEINYFKSTIIINVETFSSFDQFSHHHHVDFTSTISAILQSSCEFLKTIV